MASSRQSEVPKTSLRRWVCNVSKLRFRISMSPDGFVAGPRQSVDNPLGIGGTRLYQWAFPLTVWRAMHGLPLLGSGERLFEDVGDDLHGLELVRTVAAPRQR
jgi:hypothetical protein